MLKVEVSCANNDYNKTCSTFQLAKLWAKEHAEICTGSVSISVRQTVFVDPMTLEFVGTISPLEGAN